MSARNSPVWPRGLGRHSSSRLLCRPAGTIAALLIALTSSGAPAPRQRTLLLAHDRRAAYVIHLSADPTPAERLAAAELASYLHRITGAQFAIRRGGIAPQNAIIVSGHGIPGIPGVAGEGYAIAVRDSRILLGGGRGRSALYAVYDFLERLGCRWLAPRLPFYSHTPTLPSPAVAGTRHTPTLPSPAVAGTRHTPTLPYSHTPILPSSGSAAEFVPERPRLTFECPGDIVERPVLAHRKIYVEEGHSHDAASLRRIIEWMPKLRYNTLVVPADYQGRGVVKWDNWRQELAPELQRRDLVIEVGGHGYQNFLNAEMEGGQLFERHPEWFGQDAAGQRRKEPGRVFCTSNPEAVQYVIERFTRYVRERPEIRTFDFWPPDGARWCECERCRALGSPSNRQALLVNQVKAAVERVCPDLRLECLAYSTSVTPPENANLDAAVLVDFCPIAQCFEVQIDDPAARQNADYVKGLTAWRRAFTGEISIYSYYRKYAWRSLPAMLPHYMQKDLQWYARVPVQGISTYAEPGDWGAYELNHYVLGHLAWSPQADVDRLVDEFCAARYGPAAAAARETFATLEKVVRIAGSLPGTRLKPVEQIAAGIRDLEAAETRLRAVTPAGSPATRPVARLLLCVEYARRDLELQRCRAANATAADTRAKVESLAAFLKEHQDQGVFLMHRRLELPSLLRTYGVQQ